MNQGQAFQFGKLSRGLAQRGESGTDFRAQAGQIGCILVKRPKTDGKMAESHVDSPHGMRASRTLKLAGEASERGSPQKNWPRSWRERNSGRIYISKRKCAVRGMAARHEIQK